MTGDTPGPRIGYRYYPDLDWERARFERFNELVGDRPSPGRGPRGKMDHEVFEKVMEVLDRELPRPE